MVVSGRPTEQILNGLADLHELIQARRLGDELGNSEVLEQRLVSPGLRRAPHANRDAGQVLGGPNLAQDLFASVLGEVQVHQDQVWKGRLGIDSLPANKSEGVASVQQVNQFKWEILFLQSPIEKEDVRGVVLNDQDSGCAHIRSVLQAHLRSAHAILPPVLLLRSTAGAPARRNRKGNRSPASVRSRLTRRV